MQWIGVATNLVIFARIRWANIWFSFGIFKKWTGTPFRFKKRTGTPFRCVPVQFEPCLTVTVQYPIWRSFLSCLNVLCLISWTSTSSSSTCCSLPIYTLSFYWNCYVYSAVRFFLCSWHWPWLVFWISLLRLTLLTMPRQLRLVRLSLTMDAAHALVRAMIHSRLDYCNSLLAGLLYWPDVLSTVSFTCGCSTCARPAWSCSSVSSHAWHAPLVEFPSAFRVQVMSADIQMSPWSDTWLIVSLLHVLHVSGRPLLRSADANKLLIPRSFRSSGPNAWNGMLAHLRNSDLTLSDFRQLLLKLALFRTVSVQLPSVPLWQSCAFRNMKLTDNETHRRKYTQDKHNKTLEKEEKESTINTSILK